MTKLATTTTTPAVEIGHKALIEAHEHLVDKDYDKMKYRFYDPDSPNKQFGALIVVPIQFKVKKLILFKLGSESGPLITKFLIASPVWFD